MCFFNGSAGRTLQLALCPIGRLPLITTTPPLYISHPIAVTYVKDDKILLNLPHVKKMVYIIDRIITVSSFRMTFNKNLNRLVVPIFHNKIEKDVVRFTPALTMRFDQVGNEFAPCEFPNAFVCY